ncbi:TorF family putative porin [Novosphingobium bradum]|uniref:TorF family putative porin n=1 Tax=Novosphingobium bradum TaxID=1737444 RepID=A0ABV7IMA9_9SPHN
MKKIIKAALATTAFASAFAAAPAFADDAIKITGSATLATEYSLRGVSQTDRDAAIQGGITATHSSGIYVGTWASNLAGYGTFGGSNMELDLIGGYSKALGPVTLDGGVVYYVYPGANGHPLPGSSYDYVELYGSVSGKVGPVNAKLGTYWAPKQNNIGGHNVWVYTDLGLPIGGTPITLKAHGGISTGTSAYTKGLDVVDYSVGADFAYKMLTFNVSYVGTDVSSANAVLWTSGGNASGRQITKGRIVASLTAAF